MSYGPGKLSPKAIMPKDKVQGYRNCDAACDFQGVLPKGDTRGHTFSNLYIITAYQNCLQLAEIGLNIKGKTISKGYNAHIFPPAKNKYKIKFHEGKIHVYLVHCCILSY